MSTSPARPITASASLRNRVSTAAERPVGRIVSISGSQAIVALANGSALARDNEGPSMGMLLKIAGNEATAVGIVSGVSIPVPSNRADEPELKIVEIELVGEVIEGDHGPHFQRGVAHFPPLGASVFAASSADLEVVYKSDAPSPVRIGTVHQDPSIPANVLTDDLLAKHFAVVGTTGTGKSCAVALILRGILDQHPNAHIVVLDPHNEYAPAFQDRAELITPQTLQIPYWLLNFDEIVEVLLGGETNRRLEVEILRDLIPLAKQAYRGSDAGSLVRKAREGGAATPLTVDTPMPYRLADVVSMIDQMMGKLDKPENLAPYKRLKARIEALTVDARYSFMFGGMTVRDVMADVIGRIFRVPVDGKPITVMDLSGVPAEILNVVVSVVCRLAFDFALWSDRSVPITLVCEEAHRYVPRDPSLGFEPTKRAISRIAKEGRKYGVSLCVVTQRPAELAPTILSQSSTIFSMRLTNQNDQEIVRAAISDAAVSLLDFLPSLGNGEAIAIGEGVTLPMRIRFDQLPEGQTPRSSGARFSEEWCKEPSDPGFLDSVVERWRSQRR